MPVCNPNDFMPLIRILSLLVLICSFGRLMGGVRSDVIQSSLEVDRVPHFYTTVIYPDAYAMSDGVESVVDVTAERNSALRFTGGDALGFSLHQAVPTVLTIRYKWTGSSADIASVAYSVGDEDPAYLPRPSDPADTWIPVDIVVSQYATVKFKNVAGANNQVMVDKVTSAPMIDVTLLEGRDLTVTQDPEGTRFLEPTVFNFTAESTHPEDDEFRWYLVTNYVDDKLPYGWVSGKTLTLDADRSFLLTPVAVRTENLGTDVRVARTAGLCFETEFIDGEKVLVSRFREMPRDTNSDVGPYQSAIIGFPTEGASFVRMEIKSDTSFFMNGDYYEVIPEWTEMTLYINDWSYNFLGLWMPTLETQEEGVMIRKLECYPGYYFEPKIEGAGQIVRNPDREYYLDGETVELTAVPDEGWVFGRWFYDYYSENDATREVTFPLNEDIGVAFYPILKLGDHDFINAFGWESVMIDGQYAVRSTLVGDPNSASHGWFTVVGPGRVLFDVDSSSGGELLVYSIAGGYKQAITGTRYEFLVDLDGPVTFRVEHGSNSYGVVTATIRNFQFESGRVLVVAEMGSGTVEQSVPGTIFEEGKVVEVTAHPPEGATFVKWEVSKQNAYTPAYVNQNPYTWTASETNVSLRPIYHQEWQYPAVTVSTEGTWLWKNDPTHGFVPSGTTRYEESALQIRSPDAKRVRIRMASGAVDPELNASKLWIVRDGWGASGLSTYLTNDESLNVDLGGNYASRMQIWGRSETGSYETGVTNVGLMLDFAYLPQFNVNGGTITVTGGDADGYVDLGQSFHYVLTPYAGTVFKGWTGDLTDMNLEGDFVIVGPFSATAEIDSWKSDDWSYRSWASFSFPDALSYDFSVAGARMDPDHDHWPNYLEYLLNTDPLEPISNDDFKITYVAADATHTRGSIQIRYPRPFTSLYIRLQYASAPEGTWATAIYYHQNYEFTDNGDYVLATMDWPSDVPLDQPIFFRLISTRPIPAESLPATLP